VNRFNPRVPSFLTGLLASLVVLFNACNEQRPSSDQIQRQQQEQILQEGTRVVGMPSITRYRERKLLKMIYEMRDEGLTTFTYAFIPGTGKLRFICESIGYPIPYSTQFTNPQKIERHSSGNGYQYPVISQADPNGLYSPPSSEATWVLCKDPNSAELKPVYQEPRLMTFPYRVSED